MRKKIIFIGLLVMLMFNQLPLQLNAAESKCAYYIESSHGYKSPDEADAALANADTDGSQAPYLLSKGYRLSFWGGTMTIGCVIDLTGVTVNGGSVTAAGPGQSVTVIGDGDDVFDGRMYLEAGNWSFTNVKFKRTQATTEDTGITININEHTGGGSRYYFDKDTEIITGDFIPSSSQIRQAIQVSKLGPNSQVIFDGSIKMETGGIGFTAFNPSRDINDNSLIQFNGTMTMGPTSFSGFYLDKQTSNLQLTEKSSIVNSVGTAPVFSFQNNTQIKNLSLMGKITADSIMREGTFTGGGIENLTFGGQILAATPGNPNLTAIYSEQLAIDNLQFLPSFSITDDFSYLLAKYPTKGNAIIKNLVFDAGATVSANTGLYVGGGQIENITFNGNIGKNSVLQVGTNGQVGTASLKNMTYNNPNAIIIDNEGVINNLNIGDSSYTDSFVVERLIKNTGVSAFIHNLDVKAIVVTDQGLFNELAAANAAFSIENSDASKYQIENPLFTETLLLGQTVGVNDGTEEYLQVQPSKIEATIVSKDADSISLTASIIDGPVGAEAEMIIISEDYQRVSEVFNSLETVTFATEPGKKYYVANLAKVDTVNHIVYSSIVSTVVEAANEYQVTFDISTNGGEGTAPANQNVVEGAKIAAPATQTKTGSAFTGWNTLADGSGISWDFATDVMPANNLTLYAQFSDIPTQNYQVTFDITTNGGQGISPASQTAQVGAKIVAPIEPSKLGADFTGWNTTADGSGTTWNFDIDMMPAHDVTLYAQFLDVPTQNYQVTFDITTNGGQGISPASQTAEAGAKIVTPIEPSKPGADFTGWNTTADGSGISWNFDTDVMPAHNLTLYAQFSDVPTQNYQVTFDITTNGGQGTVPTSQSVSEGQSIMAPLELPTKADASFTGWNTNADGSGTMWDFNINMMPSHDLTLYAQFSANVPNQDYYIIYNGNGNTSGETPKDTKVYKKADKTSIMGVNSNFAKAGFKFIGWSEKTDATKEDYDVNDEITVDKTIILYAVWEKESEAGTLPVTGESSLLMLSGTAVFITGILVLYRRKIKQ